MLARWATVLHPQGGYVVIEPTAFGTTVQMSRDVR